MRTETNISVEAHSAELRKDLGVVDLTLTQILFIIGLPWVGVAAKQGPAHVILWLAAIVFFYLPSAAVVIHLNRAMPLEGGLYQWAKVAFDDFVAFMVAWNFWIFGILVMSWLSKREPMNTVVRPSHFNDWGNLLMTLVMLWTYFAFSQYLIIWSGNLPEETIWFVARKHGGWGVIALAIVILQFFFPFLTLLSRAAKRSPQKLALLAVLILAMRIVDVIWLIEPSFNRERFHLSWMDLVAPIAMGGLWMATFAWQLQKRPLVPINDSQLEQALAAHAGH